MISKLVYKFWINVYALSDRISKWAYSKAVKTSINKDLDWMLKTTKPNRI